MRRPNVVLLYTDQQRWDTIRRGGNEHILTPNLDRLADGGVLLANAFCNNPVCMPSRQSMLSGQYPSVVGTCTNGIEMPEDALTLHKVLKPYGYHTANIGKLHFRNHSNRDHREAHGDYGFDTLILSDEPGCYDDAYIKWVEQHDPSQVDRCRCSTPPAWTGVPVEKHPRRTDEPYVFDGPEHLTHTAFVAEETCHYIRRHKDDTFFAIAGFYAPHAPLNPPKRFVEMYDPASLPGPARNEGENRLGHSDDEWRRIKAYYYALITHIDDQIGRVLGTLDECGLRDDTLVIFTSDHGEHLGDHGLIGKGPPGLESCAHVPMVVSCPGADRLKAGLRAEEIIEQVDVAPTVLDYCGVQVPPAFQGRSFRPLLEGRDYLPRTSAFIEFRQPFGTSWKTVRTHEHKYCACSDGREILFDLTSDPHELTNVAGEGFHQSHRDALNRMRAELLRRWFDVEKQYPLRTGAY